MYLKKVILPKQTNKEKVVSKLEFLKVTTAAHSSVISMVGNGKLSMQAAFLMNYIIDKNMENRFVFFEVPAIEIRQALGVKSPSVGYKYVQEALDAGVLDAIKEAGKPTKYRPNYSALSVDKDCFPYSSKWLNDIKSKSIAKK